MFVDGRGGDVRRGGELAGGAVFLAGVAGEVGCLGCLAGDGQATTWLEPVTDDQYNAAHTAAGEQGDGSQRLVRAQRQPRPTSRQAGRPARTTAILAVILISYVMILLDNSVIFIGIPSIPAELGLSPAGLSWVQDAYTLVFGGLLLLGARVGDILGRRRLCQPHHRLQPRRRHRIRIIERCTDLASTM